MYFVQRFPYTWELGTFQLVDGDAQVSVVTNEVVSIESVGKRVEGKLEVVVHKADGTSVRGNIGATDMLVWSTPHGYEGVELWPGRRLTVEVVKP